MEQRLPKHHVKQEVCATRPAYREGRVPKAVKVYTINNESKYILIQGVPAVGTMKELIQLCSSYGDVEEHHPLDEYPCEDKYTEVYLVKYKKIQSARFAKRKLDDHSFFGGNLHVCYAPEYETVAETREKLLDRRRVIAYKIRKHKNECRETKAVDQVIRTGHTPSLPSTSTTDLSSDSIEKSHAQSSSPSSFQYIPEIDGNVHTKDLPLSPQDQPQSSQTQSQFQSYHSDSAHTSHTSSNQSTFELPLPPKPSVHNEIESKYKYEYSRVPSKHSTLPANYDGRVMQLRGRQEQFQQNIRTGSSHSTSNSETKSSTKEILHIKKDFTPHKQALKFVPRQAVKRKSGDSAVDGSNNVSSDVLDKKIRQNAFVLGDKQGPADLPGRSNKVPEITPGASKSYYDTIKSIRSKISQVITDSVIPKKSTSKTN